MAAANKFSVVALISLARVLEANLWRLARVLDTTKTALHLLVWSTCRKGFKTASIVMEVLFCWEAAGMCGSKLGKKQRLVHFTTRALQIKMETRKRFSAPLESSSPMSRERTPPTIERITFRSLSVVARVADMSEDVRRMRPARWIDPRTGIIQPYSLRPAQGAAILQVIVSCAQSLVAPCPLCASWRHRARDRFNWNAGGG